MLYKVYMVEHTLSSHWLEKGLTNSGYEGPLEAVVTVPVQEGGLPNVAVSNDQDLIRGSHWPLFSVWGQGQLDLGGHLLNYLG